jgi:hypothetical protein
LATTLAFVPAEKPSKIASKGKITSHFFILLFSVSKIPVLRKIVLFCSQIRFLTAVYQDSKKPSHMFIWQRIEQFFNYGMDYDQLLIACLIFLLKLMTLQQLTCYA